MEPFDKIARGLSLEGLITAKIKFTGLFFLVINHIRKHFSYQLLITATEKIGLIFGNCDL